MPNRRRGEIAARIAGCDYTLCLTLGALAELEDALDGEGLFALIDRFGAGDIRVGDLIKIIGAGLRGGGHQIADDEVAAMNFDSVAAAAEVTARLLKATFAFAVDKEAETSSSAEAAA